MPKTADHEVKAYFAREFAAVEPVAVESVAYSASESLSSASSFRSISTKKSISDTSFDSASDIANASYLNTSIPGVEELILKCADINLGNEKSFENVLSSAQDLSQDQTFASAIDEFAESDCSFNEDLRPDSVADDKTQVIEANPKLNETTCELNETCILVSSDNTNDILSVTPIEEQVPQIEEESALLQKSDDTANKFETFSIGRDTIKESLPTSDVDSNQSNVTTTVIADNSVSNVVTTNEEEVVESDCSTEIISSENFNLCHTEVYVPSKCDALFTQHTESPPLPSISTVSSEDIDKSKEKSLNDLSEPAENPSLIVSSSDNTDLKLLESPSIPKNNSPVVQTEKESVEEQELLRSPDHIASDNNTEKDSAQLSTSRFLENVARSDFLKEDLERENLQTSIDTQDLKIQNDSEDDGLIPIELLGPQFLDQDKLLEYLTKEREDTLKSEACVNAVKEKEISIEEEFDRTLTFQDLDCVIASDEDQYAEFKPQRQSTTLSLREDQPDDIELTSIVEKISNNLTPSQNLVEEQFVSATAESKHITYTKDFILKPFESLYLNFID